jgi:signal transduction histidine kinase
VKQLWKHYTDSFVDIEAAHAECAPISVIVAVLGIAGAIVAASFATEAVGLKHLWVPLAFLGAAGISSIFSWLVGVRRRSLFMALQALEFNLYGLPFISAATFSKVPAAYAFAAFYALILQHWARLLNLTFLGALFVLLCPLAFAAAFHADLGELFIIGLGGVFFLYTSANTTRHAQQATRAARAGEVLQQIDVLLSERIHQGASDRNLANAVMFHELKNTIGPARWNLESLASSDEVRDSADLEIVEDIRGLLGKAAQLIDEFVALDRKDPAQKDNDGYWLEELPGSLAEIWSPKDTVLEKRAVLFENLPRVKVKGPKTYLVLTLRNLIANAFEAGATLVRVQGELSHQGAGVVIVVTDNGPGLPEKISEHLFEPFNTHGKAQGTGLGIYLAKRLMESLGGSIALESKSTHGTAFELSLPIVLAQSSGSPLAKPVPDPFPPKRNRL